MTETTRGIAKLPSLDVELVHDKSESGDAERLAIRVTGRPDLESAAKMVEPHLLTMMMAANPFLAAPMKMAQQFWAPWLAMNPALKALLPPPERD
jgi:hypothetical protein